MVIFTTSIIIAIIQEYTVTLEYVSELREALVQQTGNLNRKGYRKLWREIVF